MVKVSASARFNNLQFCSIIINTLNLVSPVIRCERIGHLQVRTSEDSTDGTIAMKEVKIEVTWKVLKKGMIIIIDFHQLDEDLQVQMAAVNDRHGGVKL